MFNFGGEPFTEKLIMLGSGTVDDICISGAGDSDDYFKEIGYISDLPNQGNAAGLITFFD